MSIGNGMFTVMRVIKAAGVLVVFLIALGSPPQPLCGEQPCETYLLDDCIELDDCEELAETPCGEQLPGCEDKGWVVCSANPECDPNEVAMSCYFPPRP
jgi:hypothetical protein